MKKVVRNYFSFTIITLALTLATQLAYAKTIVISIDGTNNDPGDATDRYNEVGMLEDASISNVFKLHLYAGGLMDNTAFEVNANKVAFYYMGVGNRDKEKVLGRFRSKFSAAVAVLEPEKIEAEVDKDLAKHCNPCDDLYIFGFSRGAATARKIAQKIATRGVTINGENQKPTVKFLGVWDTVAAFGFSGDLVDPNKYPSSTILDDIDGLIAGNIEQAYHLVSIDDPRLAFRPTLVGPQSRPDFQSSRVQEIWFPGVHSDIGGGYEKDGLSDVTLQFMINRAKDAGLSFRTLEEIRSDDRIDITADRLNISPNATDGKLHFEPVVDEKGFAPKVLKLLHERELFVSDGDHKIAQKPVLHHTVLTRMNTRADYEPGPITKLQGSYMIDERD